MIVTSRPEGVTLSRYLDSFAVLNLLPLTDEQQRAIIAMQIASSRQSRIFERLLAAVRVAQDADALYASTVKAEATRRKLEALEAPDTTRLPGSRRHDPQRRPRDESGQPLATRQPTVPMRSAWLRRLDEDFHTAGALAALDTALDAAPGAARDDATSVRGPPADVEGQIGSLAAALLPPSADGRSPEVLSRLGVLLGRRRRAQPTMRAAQLWELIATRSDAVYAVAERLHAGFEAVVADLGGVHAELAPLKDPVSVLHEPAA